MRNSIFQEPEITVSLGDAWNQVRVPLIEPIFYLTLFAYVSMFIMFFVERLYMASVIMFVKSSWEKGFTQYKLDAIREKMEQNKEHPTVLIQILVHNESEVYKLSIGAACALIWPPERRIVQVIDNSTNIAITTNLKAECRKWQNQGINIKYENRGIRQGCYAGGLQEGLKKQYVNDCEYVVIFNADYQPEKDFLEKTIPRLIDNKDLGMVETRLMFDECLMTGLQESSLKYHFSIGREVGSSTSQFFGFNDIAGQQIQAIIDAGGWKERLTWDEMDLAARAHLQRWKFVSVGDVC